MTPTRAAMEAARTWIRNGRDYAYNAMCFNEDGDLITSAFTPEQKAELAKHDAVLSLLDAALAAPDATADLLAATKALLPALEQDEQDAVTGIFGTATYDAMDALRAAIAKAEGKTP